MVRTGFSVPLIRAAVLGLAGLGMLGGCGLFDDEEILSCERIHIRAEPAAAKPLEARQMPVPATVSNADWTQTNGNASHNSGNLAGPTSLTSAWNRNAGAGRGDRSEITGAPIVVNGTVFAMDAGAHLGAFDACSGSARWRVDLSPAGEKGTEGFGGGLAADGGTV